MRYSSGDRVAALTALHGGLYPNLEDIQGLKSIALPSSSRSQWHQTMSARPKSGLNRSGLVIPNQSLRDQSFAIAR
jgi:hypothetical protein